MIFRPFGNTGKQVSAISFGAMRFRPEDYKKDLQICADILLRAHELGVNYFDTAPLYCESLSEKIVGLARKQIRGEKPYISTKCNFRTTFTAQEAYDEIQKSRDLLEVDTIDFYHMWSIRVFEQYQDMTKPGGVYDGFLRAQEEGLIGHICASVHANGEDIRKIAQDGKVDVITLGYNATNFAYRQEGLHACYENNLGVVIMNPLSGGLIPRNPDYFSFLKQGEDESIIHAALGFLLGQKEISTALVGPASIEELEECVKVAQVHHEMSAEVFEGLKKQINTKMDALCTSCAYCDECPVGIPIVPFLSLYNESLLGEKMSTCVLRMRLLYDLAPEHAAKCIRCGICENLCTQKLPIMDRLEEISKQEPR